MESVLGSSLISGNHQNFNHIPTEALNNVRYVLLYFSAHWCPPCRAFTPKLGLFYEQINAAQKQVEIVFVSADRTPDQFAEYFDTMPFLAIPFEEQSKRNTLAQKYGITGIPALLLIDNQGNVKRQQCKEDVLAKGPQALSDWANALH